MSSRRIRMAVLTAAAAMALAVSPASAHTGIISSSPKAGATVKALPKTVSATFGAVLLSANSATLRGPDGKNHAVSVELDPAKRTRVLVTTRNSKAGRYTLNLTVKGADTHTIKANFSFRVSG
jgi:copper resistance protein C